MRQILLLASLILAALSCVSPPPVHQAPTGLHEPQTTRPATPPTAETVARRMAVAEAAPDSEYHHDRFGTLPIDTLRQFDAFLVSLDGEDDETLRGVPEWVAYEMRATPPGLGSAPGRPRKWATDNALHEAGLAPDDSTYRNSGFSRGHMCMKQHAFRVSADADRETHTVLNACPQLQTMNNGVWKAIEMLTGDWADSYGAVWIVTGPIFLPNKEAVWIGDGEEIRAGIPDAFFKVVVKEDGDAFDVLAFIVPMRGDSTIGKSSASVSPYLTSVDIIEALTGLDLLTQLPAENDVEQRVFTQLWSTDGLDPIVAAPVEPPQGALAPTATPNAAASTQPASTPDAGLRSGIQAPAADITLATKIKAAGWTFMMPRPKSSKARWGNSDSRTTWWPGHWQGPAGRYSSSQPKEIDGWTGNGVRNTDWRKGGTPGAPTVVQWLCSTSGGISPR